MLLPRRSATEQKSQPRPQPRVISTTPSVDRWRIRGIRSSAGLCPETLRGSGSPRTVASNRDSATSSASPSTRQSISSNVNVFWRPTVPAGTGWRAKLPRGLPASTPVEPRGIAWVIAFPSVICRARGRVRPVCASAPRLFLFWADSTSRLRGGLLKVRSLWPVSSSGLRAFLRECVRSPHERIRRLESSALFLLSGPSLLAPESFFRAQEPPAIMASKVIEGFTGWAEIQY